MTCSEDDIKRLIIDTLALEDVSIADIDTHAPLFGDGLGLDSIDALELGIALQRKYGLAIAGNSAETRAHFASVATLVLLVSSAGGQQARAA